MSLRRLIHVAVAILLGLALIALWSAYDRREAAVRFALLCVATAAFWLISQGGRKVCRYTTRGMALFGIAISLGFLIQLALAPLHKAWLEAKIPVGLTVIVLPFLVAEWRIKAQGPRGHHLNVWLLATVLALASIALSSSVASALVLALGAALSASWGVSFILSRVLGWGRLKSFATALTGVGGAAGCVLLLGERGFLSLLPRETIDSRLELVAQAARLALDYPIVGGGLGSIPGLYAHYIRGLPVLFVAHSHNLYLNLAIEIGILGLMVFAVLLVASAVLLAGTRAQFMNRSPGSRCALDASLAGLCALLLLGSIDDPLYANWALPVLFVFPALAVSFASESGSFTERSRPEPVIHKRLIALVAVVFIGLAAINWRTLTASWFSNLGAVEMSKVELSAWPSGKWSEGDRGHRLSVPEGRFLKARQYRPRDRTALHRLGLIAMERREYANAVDLLSEAHLLDPGHRGIRKALGFSLVWIGDYHRARTILSEIEEAPHELRAYQDWWLKLGRPDLSDRAAEMLELLQAG